jgi:hypothetical protein
MGKPRKRAATTPAPVDPNRAAELVDLIHKEQGKSLASVIRIGQHLAELRPLAQHGHWAEQCAALGMNTRMASRHMRISESPLKEIGLSESDLAVKIPTDLNKLEWLAKLPLQQVVTLAAELNLKLASRDKVEEVVRKLVKLDPRKPRTPTKPPAGIDKQFGEIASLITEHLAKGGDAADLQDTVAAGIRIVKDALNGGVPTDSSDESE